MTCDQLWRICRTLELDPVICDVIILRYQKATGIEPILISRADLFLYPGRSVLPKASVKGGKPCHYCGRQMNIKKEVEDIIIRGALTATSLEVHREEAGGQAKR